MMIMLELALAVVLVWIVWTTLGRGRRSDRRDALTLRRVDAYIETIRRERRQPELAAMSDTELRDLLHAGALNLRAAEQKRSYVLAGTAAVTLVAAIVVADQNGWAGFAAVAALGGLVGYGLNEYLGRQMRAPLERRGVDIDRLRVD